jgi:hypothetical protein
MKIKTLLLGTAAAFVVAGSAQAADLAVAESVEYVKVCDAYGAGYFYVPGSDVCLKIGGYVQVRSNFFSDQVQLGADPSGIPVNIIDGSDADGLTPDPLGGTVLGDPDSTRGPYKANFRFFTETSLNATAKWMTDWGAATVFLDYRSDVDIGNNQFSLGALHGVFLDTGYLKLGGLKAGWDASTYDWGFNGFIGFESPFDHDQHMDQFQWSTTLGGFGFFIALEDPRDNGIFNSSYYTGDAPDIVVALTNSVGAFTWKWSAAATDTIYGTGWGTQLGIGWNGPGGGFVKVQGAYGNDAGALYAANIQPNNSGADAWHVSAQGGIAWTSAFSSLIGGSYRAEGGFNEWEASIEADWLLAKGVQFGIAAQYYQPDVADAVSQVEARIQAGF